MQLEKEQTRVLGAKGEALQQQQAAAVKLHLCLEEHSRLTHDRYGTNLGVLAITGPPCVPVV